MAKPAFRRIQTISFPFSKTTSAGLPHVMMSSMYCRCSGSTVPVPVQCESVHGKWWGCVSTLEAVEYSISRSTEHTSQVKTSNIVSCWDPPVTPELQMRSVPSYTDIIRIHYSLESYTSVCLMCQSIESTQPKLPCPLIPCYLPCYPRIGAARWHVLSWTTDEIISHIVQLTQG